MENTIYIENTALSFTILKKLVKLGIRSSIFPFDSIFLKDELEKIESITLTSDDSLSEINKLTNLKSLCILGNYNINEDIDNHYEEIEKIRSLENIYIFNINNLYDLDLGNLVNLRTLRLINNNNLSNLKGLDNLKELKEVIICGNNIKEIKPVDVYINNTSDTVINILDVNMFDNMFGKNKKNKKLLEDRLDRQWSNINFGEMLAFDNECYKLDYYQMSKMYNKANNILSELKIDDADDMTKVTKIYEYIVNNLSYDYEELENRNKLYDKRELLSTKDNDYLKRRMLVINTSYSAIIGKKSVCDGYVNMMRLLLNMCNIESRKVLCSYNDPNAIRPNHAIIKFKIDDNWYYADPEKEQQTKTIDFFLLTLDEIKKTHSLPITEKDNELNKEYRKK